MARTRRRRGAIYPTLHVLTDPSWLIAMRYRADGGSDAGVFLGSSVLLAVAWIAATCIGHVGGTLIADPRRYGIDLVMPIFFAAMLIPLWRGGRPRRSPGSSPAWSRSRCTSSRAAGGSSSPARSPAAWSEASSMTPIESADFGVLAAHRGDGGRDLCHARGRLLDDAARAAVARGCARCWRRCPDR